MKKILACCLLACMIMGCAGPRSPYNYSEEKKITTYTDIGQVKDVRIEDTIIHYQVESVADVLEVPRPLHIEEDIFLPIFIPKGTYVKTGEDESRIFFEPESIKGKVAKTNSENVTDIVYIKKSHELTVSISNGIILRNFDSGFSIKRNTRLKEQDSDKEMRSLAYAGAHKNLVSFTYREGKNEQRITHNMDTGHVFRYQGAEIEILSYDAHSIKCKVLKGFDIFT